MRRGSLYLFALISALSLASHAQYALNGLVFINSDYAIHPLTADLMGRGTWTAFQLQEKYGGNGLNFLRFLWCEVWRFFSGGETAAVSAHFWFSWLVVPGFTLLTFWVLARRFVSKEAALLVALVSAVSFNWLDYYSQIDFYSIYLILGCLLLAIRGRTRSPLREWEPGKLFGVAVLSGFATYNCRAALIYVVAAFLPPWAEIRKELKTILSRGSRLKDCTLGLAVFFLGLYVYLELFGPVLGEWKGRQVKLHAGPNLTYGVFLCSVLWLWSGWKRLTGWHWARAGALAGGFALGFLPEILHRLLVGDSSSVVGQQSHGLSETLRIAGTIPGVLQSFFSGGESILRIFPTALLCWLVIEFVLEVRKSKVIRPIAVCGVLCLYAYSRVISYSLSPPRYLYPIYPVLILMIGVGWDRIKSRPRARWVFGLLLVIWSADQLVSRQGILAREKAKGQVERIAEVVDRFQSEQVAVVISDDYWHTNSYSLVSRGRPWFAQSRSHQIVPAVAWELAQVERRVGLLMGRGAASSGVRVPGERKKFDVAGYSWSARYLATVGDRELYVGER